MIVTKVPLDLCVRRHEGGEVGGAEQIECDDSLGQQSISELHLEAGITSAQDSHKVFFSGADGPLYCFLSVQVGWSQLVIDSFIVKEYDKCTRCFVVESLEAGGRGHRKTGSCGRVCTPAGFGIMSAMA